ncbi:MAG TPA: extracellular solute-binding protein [Candidatus Paceibacterota bacterium]
MSKFQIITIAIFVVCIIAGVALFATYKSKNADSTLPAITVWGVFPQSVFSNLLQQLNNTRAISLSINYVEKTESTFDKDFIETLARGQGPDAILIPQDMIVRHADKIVQIPYTVLSQRDFKNSYISQAELYLTSTGALAIPLTIDPLVMYWNRDLFANAGIAVPPRFWDEFGGIISRIALKDVNSNIRRSAIAMGEFGNISHAREILGALLLQSGNPITRIGENGAGNLAIESALGDGQYIGTKTSVPAINFFTKFSNPNNPDYSWNRGLPISKSWFLSGSLATYFGFSSELFDIRDKNPNIDFDVAPLPQARGGVNRTTYGSMYGLSIVRSVTNQAVTYAIIQALTSPESLAILNKLSYLPPVRRDMIQAGSSDPYQAIFYDSALISKSWLDINVVRTREIFKNMVESITSGRADSYSAIKTAHEELDLSIRNQ